MTNLHFHGLFLFQPVVRLIGPTTDSFLNDGLLLQNYGPYPPWYIFKLLTELNFCEDSFLQAQFSGVL